MTQDKLDNILSYRKLFAYNVDWQDDTKGILAFVKTMFPQDCVNKFAPVHLELARNLLQIFNPRYTFLQERQLQETLFRGCAKSTWTNLFYITYIIANNGSKIIIPDWDLDNDCLYSNNTFEVEVNKNFVVLISETAGIAETWVTRVRGELGKNRYLKLYYGSIRDESVKDDEGKWTKSGFTVIKDTLPAPYTGTNLTYYSKGSGMQLRGINIKGRPDLEIWDDLYSSNNTKTPESRHKVRYFANAEAKNTVDPVKGAIISCGTIVHEDTVVVDHHSSKFWKCLHRPIMDRVLFDEVLAKYCTIDMNSCKMTYPSRDRCRELEEMGYITNWTDRWTLEMLLATLAEHIENRMTSAFWQEYFHETMAEEDKVINQSMITTKELELVEKCINGVFYSFVKVDGKYYNVNLGIGTDSATSYKTSADNTSLIVIAKDYYNRVYVIHNESGKFAFSDEIEQESRLKWALKLCTDMNVIEREGVADKIFRYLLNKDGKYSNHRPTIVLETNNAGGELLKQFKQKMQNYGIRYNVVEVFQHLNKIERILDTMKPYYQSRAVIHNLHQETLIHELEYLGKTTRDDNADILATTVLNIRKPTTLINYETQEFKSEKYVQPDWLKPKFQYDHVHPHWIVNKSLKRY